MTTATIAAPASVPAAARRLITAPLLRVLFIDFAGLSSFFLLLSVVPLYTASAGAGEIGAGLVTATLMGATVAAEFAAPRMVARFGHRAVLAAGLVLLGLPALALVSSASMLLIIPREPVAGCGAGDHLRGLVRRVLGAPLDLATSVEIRYLLAVRRLI